MTAVGYQVSVDAEAHRANLREHRPPDPVLVIIEVLPGERAGWTRRVHQVRFTGPAWSEYGWGEERAQSRGARFGASVWIYTESAVEYRDEHGEWHVAN